MPQEELAAEREAHSRYIAEHQHPTTAARHPLSIVGRTSQAAAHSPIWNSSSLTAYAVADDPSDLRWVALGRLGDFCEEEVVLWVGALTTLTLAQRAVVAGKMAEEEYDGQDLMVARVRGLWLERVL